MKSTATKVTAGCVIAGFLIGLKLALLGFVCWCVYTLVTHFAG